MTLPTSIESSDIDDRLRIATAPLPPLPPGQTVEKLDFRVLQRFSQLASGLGLLRGVNNESEDALKVMKLGMEDFIGMVPIHGSKRIWRSRSETGNLESSITVKLEQDIYEVKVIETNESTVIQTQKHVKDELEDTWMICATVVFDERKWNSKTKNHRPLITSTSDNLFQVAEVEQKAQSLAFDSVYFEHNFALKTAAEAIAQQSGSVTSIELMPQQVQLDVAFGLQHMYQQRQNIRNYGVQIAEGVFRSECFLSDLNCTMIVREDRIKQQLAINVTRSSEDIDALLLSMEVGLNDQHIRVRKPYLAATTLKGKVFEPEIREVDPMSFEYKLLEISRLLMYAIATAPSASIKNERMKILGYFSEAVTRRLPELSVSPIREVQSPVSERLLRTTIGYPGSSIATFVDEHVTKQGTLSGRMDISIVDSTTEKTVVATTRIHMSEIADADKYLEEHIRGAKGIRTRYVALSLIGQFAMGEIPYLRNTARYKP